ncbi:MAG: DUF2391 family protein [Natrialbaceae archaeon]|nr:DUF2391 family protein [Natrialbaceae archaeon]
MAMRRPRRVPQYRLADSAQQLVGGFLLAGPFVVTEEVWRLAANMSIVQSLGVVTMVFSIGYATLYKADTSRDPDEEQNVSGIPIRFISLMAVSFGSVTILALLFGAPETFLASEPNPTLITAKAVSVGAVFSVVGAATADSVFSR